MDWIEILRSRLAYDSIMNAKKRRKHLESISDVTSSLRFSCKALEDCGT